MHTPPRGFLLASLLLALLCGACTEDTRDTCRITRQNATLLITRIEGTCQDTNLEGEDLSFADLSKVTLRNVTCPDGTNSDANGNTCQGHLRPDSNADQDMGTDAPPTDQGRDLTPEDTGTDQAEDSNEAEDLNEIEDIQDIPEDTGQDTPPVEDLTPEPDVDEPDMLQLCGQTPWEPGPCGLCRLGTTTCVDDELICFNQKCGTLCTNNDQCGIGFHCINERCTDLSEAFVPAGTFTMGSPASDVMAPQHEVTLTRPLIVSVDEITRFLWEGYDFQTEWSHPECQEFCPATDITWYETIAFSNRVSQEFGFSPCYLDPQRNVPYDMESAQAQTTPTWPNGLDCIGYRLPTESEWEYLTRATTTTAWFCGDDEACLTEVANFERNASDRPTSSSPLHANPWRLNDTKSTSRCEVTRVPGDPKLGAQVGGGQTQS